MSIPCYWGCLTSSFRGIPTAARSLALLLGDQGGLRLPPRSSEPSSPRRGAGRLMPLLPGSKPDLREQRHRNLGAPHAVPHPARSDGYRHRKGIGDHKRRASPEMPERPFFSSVRDRARRQASQSAPRLDGLLPREARRVVGQGEAPCRPRIWGDPLSHSFSTTPFSRSPPSAFLFDFTSSMLSCTFCCTSSDGTKKGVVPLLP